MLYKIRMWIFTKMFKFACIIHPDINKLRKEIISRQNSFSASILSVKDVEKP